MTAVFIIAGIAVLIWWAWPPRGDLSRFEKIQTPSGAGRVRRRTRQPRN